MSARIWLPAPPAFVFTWLTGTDSSWASNRRLSSAFRLSTTRVSSTDRFLSSVSDRPFLIVRFWSSVSDRPFLIVRLITNWDDDGRRRRWRRRLDDSSPPSSFISVSVSVRFLPRADPSIWEFFRFVSFAVDSNQLDSWLFYFLFFISFDFVLICLAGRNSWRCRSPAAAAAAATVLPSSGRFRHFIFSSIKSIYRNSSVYEQNFFLSIRLYFIFFNFFSIFLMGFFFSRLKWESAPGPLAANSRCKNVKKKRKNNQWITRNEIPKFQNSNSIWNGNFKLCFEGDSDASAMMAYRRPQASP